MKNKEQGFAYIWMLLVFTLLSVGIGQWATNYATLQQRHKEQELLRIGLAYRDAIYRYYENSPGGLKAYPLELEDLLRDPRHLKIVRYLRRLEKDPITEKDFELIHNSNNEIIGVRSSSNRKPIKEKNFLPSLQRFEKAKTYKGWTFIV